MTRPRAARAAHAAHALPVWVVAAVLLVPLAGAALPAPLSLDPGAAPPRPAMQVGQAPPHDCPPEDPVEALLPACPTRLRIAGHVLGQPALAVHPLAPSEVAVAALGGQPAQGPTASSRAGGSVWLFLSHDAAGSFEAVALAPPEEGLQGEDVALVSDAQGRLVLAALFSRPGDPGPSVVAAWRLGAFEAQAAAAAQPERFPPWAQGAQVHRIGLAHVPATDTVALLWEEHGIAPPEDHRTALGPAGYVRHARATAEPGTPWTVATETERILGPCRDLAGPVAWRETVLFGCAAGPGLALPEDRVVAGELVFHALDAASGNVTYRSWVPLSGQAQLTLLDPRDGRLALVVTEVLTPTEVRVVYTTARAAERWTGPRRLGQDLHNATEDAPVRDAAVLAFGAQQTTGLVYLLYRELPQAPPEGTSRLMGEPRMAKWLVQLSPVGGFLLREDLGVDDATARALRDPVAAAQEPEVPFPADAEDALVAFGSRNFLAYADAGELVVGELPGSDAPLQPPPRPEEPSDEVTALTNLPPRPFQPWFAALGIVLGAAMVLRVLAGRIEIKTELPTSGDRKR